MYIKWHLKKRFKWRYFTFALMIFLFMIYLLRLYTNVQTDVFHRLYSKKINHVVVHLDLKGAPPLLKYLERLLPLFVRLEVSGILIEYEDMFPYEGKLGNLSSIHHYDRSELSMFLNKANQYQLEVIPLIQTMGHMEQVLELKEFEHLREDPIYPDSICPSNEESIELIKQMLEQVIIFHSNIAPLKHIHIGCDKVLQINRCQKCRDRKINKWDIYYNHVRKVRDVIFSINSHVNVLVWDDMFRDIIGYQCTNKSNMEVNIIEPVYRDYRSKVDESQLDLLHYHTQLKNIWIASAFRGVDGRQAMLPNFKACLQNHHSWITLVLDYFFTGEVNTFNLKGIIITGRSRYSHGDPLCELLPPSVPSLILNILLIQKYGFGMNETDRDLDLYNVFEKYVAPNSYAELQCHQQFKIDFEDIDSIADYCSFEGSILLNLLKQYRKLDESINTDFYNAQLDISEIEFYSKLANLNMNKYDKTRSIWKKYLQDLYSWKIDTSREMGKFYEDFVIKEYVEYKIYILKKKVRTMLHLLEKFSKRSVFEST